MLIALAVLSQNMRYDHFEFKKKFTYCNFYIQDKYGKVYKGTEIEIRAEKWANAKKVIDEHNARFDQGLETFTLIDNDFADMVILKHLYAKLSIQYVPSLD